MKLGDFQVDPWLIRKASSNKSGNPEILKKNRKGAFTLHIFANHFFNCTPVC